MATRRFRFIPQAEYTDVEFVEGLMRKDAKVQRALYAHCKHYFEAHYRRLFFVTDFDRKDVFHNTYLTLWENIERGKLRVEQGQLVGRGGEPFVGTLSTYLMAIARLKYMEWTRSGGREQCVPGFSDDEDPPTEDLIVMANWLEEDERRGMREVISDTIAVMSPRCREILTKFYAEGKHLDDILRELTSFKSKDALKSAKSKCLGRLREATLSLYDLRRRRERGKGKDDKQS